MKSAAGEEEQGTGEAHQTIQPNADNFTHRHSQTHYQPREACKQVYLVFRTLAMASLTPLGLRHTAGTAGGSAWTDTKAKLCFGL